MEFSYDDILAFGKTLPGAAAIYEVRANTCILLYNSPELPAMLGFTPEQYIERTTGDNIGIVVEQDRERVRRGVASCVSSGTADFSYRIIIDGKIQWMHAKGRTFGTRDGIPLLAVEYMDTAEEAQILEDVLDHASDAIYTIDATTFELYYMNLKAKNFWECGDDFLGHTCYEYLRGRDSICPWCPTRSMKNGRSHFEFKGNPKPGSYAKVACHSATWYGLPAFCLYLDDISGERKAQQELKDAKENLQHIVDNIPASIIVYREKDGRVFIDNANKSSVDIGGNPQTVASGEENDVLLERYVHPDDVEVAKAGFKELFSERHQATFTYRNYAETTGRYSWLQGNGRSFPQSDGTQLGYVVFVDVSESMAARVKAEQQISEERLRMEALQGQILSASCFNVTRDFPIDINDDIAIRSKNTSGEEIRSEAESVDPRIRSQNEKTKDVLFAAASQIPDLEQRRRFIEASSHVGMIDAFERGELDRTLEYRRETSKGLIWVSTRIVLLTDPRSKDVLAFFYTTDINDQMIGRKARQRIASSGYDFISVVDAAKHTVRFLDVNDTSAAEGMTENGVMDYDAFMATAATPSPIESEREETVRSVVLDHVIKMLDEKPEYICTTTRLDTAGSAMRKQMRFCYLDEAHEYIILTGEDVTEATRVEREQREKLEEALHEAEAANAAKTNFLARMSHDIRTPLNGIIGMTELAIDEDDPATIRDYLGKVDESGKFLLSLVNDILEVAKVESGAAELHLEHYTYAEFERYLRSVIEPLCDSKGIEFIMDNPFTAKTVLVDKLRFNQIFFNLLSNAVKFTPRDGHVWLLGRNHAIEGNRLILDLIVADDGIGMSEEFQKHLFEPFSQEHTALNSNRQGTGLGLAIVKDLVDLMGATIKVESVPGHGTKFTVHFEMPIAPDVESPKPEAAAPISLAGSRVLVVEDNAINAEIVMRLLEKHGVDVTIATDGEKAVRQFCDSEQYHYDAILMDVRMPVMDGLEATRKIRALDRPDAKSIPIIAMTANAFDEDVKECLDAGMDAHMRKPVDPEMLFAVLGNIVSQKSGSKD